MFRHLFVPVDPSDHGANATAQAIALARSHGARISFRYAQAAGARGPSQAREALVRADAAARAQGLTSTAASIVAEQPARALLAAADQAGCDAIVLAHGTGQLAEPSSAARHMLVHARIPVLSIGANCVPTPIAAIDLLHNEYRRLSALLHAWLNLIETPPPPGAPIASAPLLAAIEYVRLVVHPLLQRKEVTLFRRLGRRSEAMRAELDELSRQHLRQQSLLDELATLVEQADGSDSAFAALAQAVEQYARQVWEYMGREEGVVLPAARRHLTEGDWNDVHLALTPAVTHHVGIRSDASFAELLTQLTLLTLPQPDKD